MEQTFALIVDVAAKIDGAFELTRSPTTPLEKYRALATYFRRRARQRRQCPQLRDKYLALADQYEQQARDTEAFSSRPDRHASEQDAMITG